LQDSLYNNTTIYIIFIYPGFEIVNKMNRYATLVSLGIMALYAAATITTIGMTNTKGNGIGLLSVEAQQQNTNVVTIGNCVTIGENTTLASNVTIGDNTTLAENMRIADNVRIGDNARIGESITMTSAGQMDGNASSPITSPQNATAVPINTQINISC
jgi:UDP-3-O-[3-hydroxymyristoyl] glucosamine N-acyltransferase